MASIDKLQIRGIRSFSPHRDETIEFYSPLTMIVGANGCGKTTIIECLKMACTGILPPSCSSGQSFVNDPGMTDSMEVKAHVKLRFNNKAGNPTVAIRLFQLLKKKSKLEFKRLDGTVRMTNDRGEKVSISYKCSDLDKQIPELLGVAAPMMENVVFCHQEESTWPLQEGATLKKKFDDIFDSTRYSKALESITKTKKEFAAKSKELKVEVAELGAHLTHANSTRAELERHEEAAEEYKTLMETLADRIDRADDKLAEYKEAARRASALQNELQSLQWRVEEGERRVVERQAGLEKEFHESDDELQRILQGFDSEMGQRSKELEDLISKVNKVKQEATKARDRLSILNTRRGEAFALKQQYDSTLLLESRTVATVAQKLDISPPGVSSTGRVDTASLLRGIDERLRSSRVAGEEAVSKAQKCLNTAAERNKEGRMNLQQLELELAGDERELVQINKDRVNIRAELASEGGINSSQWSAKSEAEVEFNQAKSQWDEFMTSYSTTSTRLQEEKRQTEIDIRSLQEEIAADGKLLQDMSFQRKESERLTAQMAQAESSVDGYIREVNSIADKHRSLLQQYMSVEQLGALVTHAGLAEGVRVLGGNLSQQLDQEIQNMREALEETRRNVAKMQAVKDQDSRRIRALEAGMDRLRSAEDGLLQCVGELTKLVAEAPEGSDQTNVNGIEDLNRVVAAFKDWETFCGETMMATESSHIWRNRLIKKSKPRAKPSTRICPCCEKGMTEQEAAAFENNLEVIFWGKKATPADLERTKMMYEEAKALSSKAAAFISQISGMGDERDEIKDIQERLANADDQINDLRQREETLNAELTVKSRLATELRECVYELTSVQGQWVGAVQRLEDIKGKQTRLLSLMQPSALTASGGGPRTLNDIEQDQRRREEEKDALQKKKERLMEEDSRLTRQLHTLKSNLADKDRALMEVVSRVARVTDLKDRLKLLDDKEGEIMTRKGTRIRSKVQLEQRAMQLESEDKSARDTLMRVEAQSRHELEEVQALRAEVMRVSEQCSESGKRYEDMNLDGVEREIDGVNRELESKDKALAELDPRIRDLEQQLSQRERTKKIVADNISVRSARREVEELKIELAEVERRVESCGGGRRVHDVAREIQRVEQEKQKLEREQHTHKGRMDVTIEQISELKKKLKGPLYKNIDDRHRVKNIEYETTLLAVSDLDCYHQALDSALQRFHTLRIDEINKIIKELWQLIYRGGDIDMIELVSGSEDGGGRASKSYNYRVVMRKGDTPLDMRGRCSAGQRVLASIVIRLALAETFCVSCGMLALDEPTTNLDEAHKAGLAHALSRIISSRCQQQNFQLIIITHDEDFVRMMNTELSSMTDFSLPEHYFRISRQEEGNSSKYFSHIEKIPWDDM